MAPTLVWLDSFQHQQIGATFYGTNIGVYDNAVTPASLSIVTGRRPGTFALQNAENGVAASRVSKTVPAGNRVLVDSFYIKVSAKPSVDSAFWVGVNASGNGVLTVNSATGFINGHIGTGGGTNGSVDVSDGVWHRIDVLFNTTASPFTLDVRVDGTANTQTTNALSPADITAGHLGATNNAHTLTVAYADWVRSVTVGDYPIGAHRVLAAIPNADGTHSWASTNMGPDTGGVASSVSTLWQTVDDWATVTADTTTYIQYANTTATSTEYAEILLPDYTGTVWGARAVAAVFSATTTANSATTRVVDGSNATVLDVWTGDMSDTTLRHQAQMVPSITSDTLLNALKFRVGFPTDSNPAPRWSALMIDYAVPGDGGTITNQAVAASATVSPGRVNVPFKPVPATTTTTVAMLRNTAHSIAATAALAVGRALQTGKLVVSTVTGTIVLAKTKVSLAAIAATTTITAALAANKTIRQAIAAAVTFMADVFQGVSTGVQLFFRVGKPIPATTTLTVSVLRRIIAKLVAVGTTVTAGLSAIKVSLKSIAATTTLTAGIARTAGKLVTAAATITAAITRRLTKLQAVTATTTLAAVLARKVGKLVDAATTLGVALTRRTGKLLAATATLTVGLVRGVAKRVAATSSVTAGVSAVFRTASAQVIAVTTTLTAAISRRVGHRMAAVTAVTATITRRLTTAIALAASTVFDVTVIRGVGKVLDVVMVVAVTTQRAITKTIDVLLDMGAALKRISSHMAHGFAINGPTVSDTHGNTDASTTGDERGADTAGGTGATTTGGDPWGSDIGEGR